MNKEEMFEQFISTLEDDIKSKTFLTYEEQNEWKDYLERIINSQANKYKSVLDKIKEYIKEKGLYSDYGERAWKCEKDILELLEEIE